ncbi:MAG: CRISPR-associated protein Csx3 [Candidatus Harrisonbacteria bacterium CG10_big_fil_rev_8_21_14_0_10_49_15]|uniref:CRISPR-associated protein Csx3 n=1 Tax=Candidatus Harrisonbacteria bacterium CG10_big_fil_rev_8_21_14_0_10_49_15 TaxID=1974587 RepID=A0A2H0UK44_9BACT|nr:MAG: CRISPR-associated protein Csx3 [Candidatus Harrisonbacteria bacterium CG10_big_fil_rev_8_21_14_0_10_49_15]
MSLYNVDIEKQEGGLLIRVSFGSPAQNDQIVLETATRLEELEAAGELSGGGVARVNGPASLPVAMVLAHHLAHRFTGVACFDPKMGKYVVAIAHGGQYAVGDLID